MLCPHPLAEKCVLGFGVGNPASRTRNIIILQVKPVLGNRRKTTYRRNAPKLTASDTYTRCM